MGIVFNFDRKNYVKDVLALIIIIIFDNRQQFVNFFAISHNY